MQLIDFDFYYGFIDVLMSFLHVCLCHLQLNYSFQINFHYIHGILLHLFSTSLTGENSLALTINGRDGKIVPLLIIPSGVFC